MTVEPSLFESEIVEQPAALARQLSAGRAPAEALAERVRSFAPEAIVLAARGSSDNAARYGQYLFGVHNGLVVALAAPSLFTHYESPPRLARMLVVGVSQSGQSPDIVAVVAEGRLQGALTVAVTSDPTSPLARAAEHTLALHAGEERAVAASKTYTSQLMALAMLSTAIDGDARRWSELAEAPEQLRASLAAREAAVRAAERCRDAARFVVLGRGFNYATAFEVALKVKETSYVIAEPYSSADFLHGPAALLERDFPVVLVWPSGRAGEEASAILDLLQARGAHVIAISDNRTVLDRAHAALPLPTGVPEWISPLVAVVPGQLFALALAEARGLDPDAPRGLKKVTHTR